MKLRFLKKQGFALLILILLILWSFYSYINEGIIFLLFNQNLTSISEFIRSFGFLAGIIFLFLVTLEVIVAPIPPTVLYVAGGIIFGALIGGILALIGNIIGSLIAFWIARKYGRSFVEKNITSKTQKLFDKYTDKYGALALILLRINPFTSSDAFSYIAGLTNMSYRNFIVATTIGLMPLVFLHTYIGSDILTNNPFLFGLFVLLNIIYFILFVYAILYTKKLNKKK